MFVSFRFVVRKGVLESGARGRRWSLVYDAGREFVQLWCGIVAKSEDQRRSSSAARQSRLRFCEQKPNGIQASGQIKMQDPAESVKHSQASNVEAGMRVGETMAGMSFGKASTAGLEVTGLSCRRVRCQERSGPRSFRDRPIRAGSVSAVSFGLGSKKHRCGLQD